MYIWNELSLPKGKRDGYDQIVGKSIPAAGGVARTLFVPLEFWFCRNPGLALPLIALLVRVKINIEFRSEAELVQAVAPTTASLGTTSLWVDYIFLDTDERRR